ncbi:hypothetical protein SAMN05216582_1097 [Selenomonas ruminantium]|uniref:Preprotein translocase subunit SecG n=1 Tax=Selenomonas ruminantium TaxID=971 RepID=A0A1M6TS58_SELRU|nr:hypothetical protein [Selenomonas ruminantium]SHK59757.1 hypothetical protein SAMN05216582_1097 [Selenomonas ruminantium]
MDRRSQRNHIRAARDWLGKAEDSLAREKDVQGDLKLMLAKAELAQMDPSPQSRRLSSWGGRLAALLLAMGIAGGFCWWKAVTLPVATPAVPAVTADRQGDMPEPAKLPETTPPAVPARPDFSAQPEAQPAPPVKVTEQASPAPPVEKTAPVSQGMAAPQGQPVPPKVPDVDKQQLMQSAGKILRQ